MTATGFTFDTGALEFRDDVNFYGASETTPEAVSTFSLTTAGNATQTPSWRACGLLESCTTVFPPKAVKSNRSPRTRAGQSPDCRRTSLTFLIHSPKPQSRVLKVRFTQPWEAISAAETSLVRTLSSGANPRRSRAPNSLTMLRPWRHFGARAKSSPG